MTAHTIIMSKNNRSDDSTNISFCVGDDCIITLEFDNAQAQQIKGRMYREFLQLCSETKLMSYIDKCSNNTELENLVKKYSLSDAVDFSDMHFDGAKEVVKTLVKTLYAYPKLRSRMCYVGTDVAFYNLMTALTHGDTSVLKQFGLHYICTPESSKKLGEVALSLLDNPIKTSNIVLAQAVSACGLFDAILLNKDRYTQVAYQKTLRGLKHAEEIGHSPKGCSNLDSVIYHEIGHLLDYMCDLSTDINMQKFFGALTAESIERGLSTYATTSVLELIAEAFSECMCVGKPRLIAKYVGELATKKYRDFKYI